MARAFQGLSTSEYAEVMARARLSAAELESLHVPAVAEGGDAPASPPSPPAGNTGGKFGEWRARKESAVPVPDRLICVDGKPVLIPGRRGHGGSAAFVDWVNFTFHEDEVKNLSVDPSQVVPSDVVAAASYWLTEIFGFGVQCQRDTGANFYKRSYTLGERFGLLCHGGQRNTVLVSISGEGCAGAKPGWELRLYEWLSSMPSAKLTRIDLAYDDYEGSRTVDAALDWYMSGLFGSGGRNPEVEQRGNWIAPNGKGRTLYVGSRKNGKFFRAYEKGMQLGDESSGWVRFELEMKAVDRVVPLETLLVSGDYLAGAYPALAWISETQCRVKTTQKTLAMSYEAMKAWLKLQCGKALFAMREIEGDAEKVLSEVMRAGIPSRLKLPDYRNCGDSRYSVLPGNPLAIAGTI